jgi:hypothetical protein
MEGFEPTNVSLEKVEEFVKKQKECLSPGSNRGPLVCETSVITNYTTQTLVF